jgi:hypothetical protein
MMGAAVAVMARASRGKPKLEYRILFGGCTSVSWNVTKADLGWKTCGRFVSGKLSSIAGE